MSETDQDRDGSDVKYSSETSLREVVDVQHYTGGDKCHYGCGDVAEFVVVGTTGSTRVTFNGCRDCLNRAAIYPIDNEWVDARTDEVRHA